MATEANPDVDPNSLDTHLLQYLYVGQECPKYQPGNWFVHNYYYAHRVPSIAQLAEDKAKEGLPVELILKAYESKLVQNQETLVFALAVCARQDKSEVLRHKAYEAIKTVCQMPQHFILFVKFASQLSKQQPDPKHGWGHGWRKAVNNWYLSKNALELAKCVTRYKGRYGWKHKDIIKLAHPAPPKDDIAMRAVLRYIAYGFKDTKSHFQQSMDNEQLSEVIQYIENIEDFKHCEDEVRAARLIEVHNLTLDHVPGHFLKSEEVWNALIPTMDLTTLLNNLQRMHNMGLLKSNAPGVEKITDAISNVKSLASEKIHPALVLITIKNYENSGKPLSYEKRVVQQEAEKPLPSPPKPNQTIVKALYKTLNLTLAHLEPTRLRYMVVINMNKLMLESRAWRSGNVTAAEAGCLIALSLLRCEKTVTVATFKHIGVHVVNLDRNGTFGQAMRKLQQAPVGTVDISKPMSWATHQNKKYDIFINIVDQITQKLDESREAIKAYRTKMNLPNVKLVNCTMCTPAVPDVDVPDKNVLTICGFDAGVPKIIEAFAKSLF
ncbi:60 kDa SS-A/Ro ribonucleoprotein [Orussus abietinus]|uniref:60 kDa SS-A/Ro ribonucleoprotein n=1 Tax=Orussus abietinus TaxID=222816 RepID=UPI000626A4C1|nr:60 kDa SS-A/Ro ribonucleoprotein [Orussus abietinus]